MNTSTLELLRRLYVAGVDVELNDAGGLRLSGYEPPSDLLAELKAGKDDVSTLLQEQRAGTRDDGLDSTLPRRYAAAAHCLAPRMCARLGPCSRFLTRRPCDPIEQGEKR